MADNNVNIKATITGDASGAEQSVKSFKSQLREATSDLVVMNEKFGSTSTEAVNAAKKVASLKDAIGDAKLLADTFNPDKKFVAFGQAVQGVASGFAGLQGALGLFGTQSKEVEQTLLKVQSAMALSEGISGIFGSIDAFKLMAGTIKSQVVTAFSTLKGAIAATGLGLLAIAIGYVVTNFDKVKQAVLNLFPGLGKLASFIGGLVEDFTDFVGITSQASRNLDTLTNKTARYNEDLAAQMKVLQAYGKDTTELQKKVNENNLNLLREKLKANGTLTAEEQKQFRDLKNEQVVIDATTNAKLIEANNKKNTQIEADNKAANDRAKAAREKAAKEAEAAFIAEGAARKKLSTEIEIDTSNQTIINASQLTKTVGSIQLAAQQKHTEDEDFFSRLRKKLATTESQEKIAAAMAVSDALSGLSELAGKQTVAGKILAIASATINTYVGATKALAQGGIAGIAAAVGVVAAGLSSVKNIVAVKVPGVSGGGSVSAPTITAPSAPISPQQESTRLDNQSIQNIGNAAVAKTFVVESDITNNRERIELLNRQARL